MVGFLLSDYQGRERGKGRVGEGGREENRMGGRGHPSEMECMQRIFKGGQVEGGQFSCKYKSVCRLSHLNMAASFHMSKPHSSNYLI